MLVTVCQCQWVNLPATDGAVAAMSINFGMLSLRGLAARRLNRIPSYCRLDCANSVGCCRPIGGFDRSSICSR